MTPTRPTALVTGASSGIGLALARLLAREGHDLILVARDRPRLEEAAAAAREARVAATVLVKDLSEPGAAGALMAEVARAGLAVDVLVNNAGMSTHGLFLGNDPDRILATIRLNIEALTQLTRLCLPGMVSRRRGKILNVASTAAFQPGPLMAVYYASKAYVLSLSEALAEELAPHGITVTALCPGPTRTQFQARAGMGHTWSFGRGVMSAERVAAEGWRGLCRGRRVVVPGLVNRLVAAAVPFVPRPLVLRVVRGLQQTRHPLP
jgi:short-subunit dehydrogenase